MANTQIFYGIYKAPKCAPNSMSFDKNALGKN